MNKLTFRPFWFIGTSKRHVIVGAKKNNRHPNCNEQTEIKRTAHKIKNYSFNFKQKKILYNE